jgi:hypothetical protein
MNSMPLRIRPVNAHVRAGDADREAVADELTRHCADGRLTPDELSERLDGVFGARTLGELATLTGDLPRARPGTERRRRFGRLPTLTVIATLLFVLVFAAGLAGVAAQEPLAALLVLLVAFACLLVALVALVPVLLALAPVVALGVIVHRIKRRVEQAGGSSPLPVGPSAVPTGRRPG